jgi:hypothetical protein
MSSSKVKKITRTINVASFTWATNVLTINTTAAHGLVSTDVVEFMDAEFPNMVSGAITYVDADTFTMSVTNRHVKVPSSIVTGIFNNGATGAQETFTFGWANYPSALIQVSTNATGTVTCKVEGSLDGTRWVDAASAQAIGTSSAYMFEVTKPYIYGRLNFTVAVGGALGKVTASKVVA